MISERDFIKLYENALKAAFKKASNKSFIVRKVYIYRLY